MSKPKKSFIPLGIAILTVSNKRKGADDTTGFYLSNACTEAGHRVVHHEVLPHNKYQIRERVSALIVNAEVSVIVLNGGTGFASDNQTIPGIRPLLDSEITGFGELFRQLSFVDIGPASMQSQALAGLANRTLICALPGSGGAAKLAWEHLLRPQLDARQGPCNFVPHLLNERCDDGASSCKN
ncbi:molybdenum cofactor biosynthesis protein [Aliidiomarina halalkaliphila]|uniref:Molybdenum cofactor biosynthesis protein B n=1 Tax=Aliidiomarina halalkaliphila TaxID=2593535 RepID=A0A552X3S4_9GAMM|nr:molybdenum cofactor synthesis domain-containing protein [Aliidiomarina halalkaliphila]TRW49625.1 molybdenum cofactor biosynthesis protein [Aliidiomarina halalkaliphila]